MNNYIKKLLLVVLLPISLSANAQDFVVTAGMDTIKGKASILSYDVIDRIQVIDGKQKHQFTAVQVRAVQIGNDQFRPVLGDNGYRMMKLVMDGTMSLYLAKTKDGFYYEISFLVKRSGESMEVPNLSFKKMMTNFLGDCPTVKEKINQGELGRKDVKKIITEYNECIDVQTRQIISQKPVDTSDPRIVAIAGLQEKLEKSSVAGQKDMMDILKDIRGKVSKNEPVPNYLLESLKSGLKDVPELQADLQNVVTLVQPK